MIRNSGSRPWIPSLCFEVRCWIVHQSSGDLGVGLKFEFELPTLGSSDSFWRQILGFVIKQSELGGHQYFSLFKRKSPCVWGLSESEPESILALYPTDLSITWPIAQRCFFSFEFLQHRDSRYSTPQYGWIEFRIGLWSVFRAFLGRDRPNKPHKFSFLIWYSEVSDQFSVAGNEENTPWLLPLIRRTRVCRLSSLYPGCCYFPLQIRICKGNL